MDQTPSDPPPTAPAPVHKVAFGGLLMGVAMLIPGVSGGTMILALGLYTEFIDSVADVTALRFSRRPIIFLCIVGVCALIAITCLARLILYLLFYYDSAMYALFIGLTLGGAPLLYRSLRPLTTASTAGAAAGLAMMIALALGKDGLGIPHNTAVDVAAGVIGATTMVLPGISGSYMLLILDQYERVIGAVSTPMDFSIIIPVGLGAAAGIVLLSNVLKWLLHRRPRATLGVLLGMLLGSIIGLWPFGRVPTEDALRHRSTAELVVLARDAGVPDVDSTERDALVSKLLDSLESQQHGISAARPREIATALIAAVAGLVITTRLARRSGTIGRTPSSDV